MIQALIISIFFYLSNAYNGTGFYLSKYMLQRPLVGGLVCGFVYGNLQHGLELGIMLQLAYMGVFAVGGAGSMDIGAVSYPTIALALATDIDAGTATALAAGISTLSSQITNIARFANVYFNKLFKSAIEEGNQVKWELAYNVYPQVLFFIVKAVPCFLLLVYGAPAVEAVLNFLPAVVLSGMKKFSKILPAVGMGMLLKYIVTGPWSFAFFLLGFALFAYSGMNFLNVAIIAVVIAYLYYRTSISNDAVLAKEGISENFADDEEEL